MPFSKSNPRIISAPIGSKNIQFDHTKSANQSSRQGLIAESKKGVSSFNLFENFTFSTADSHDGETASVVAYQKQKNNWEDELLPQFNNLCLKTGVNTVESKENARGKFCYLNPQCQQFLISDNGFQQSNYQNFPCLYGNYPGVCVIPPQPFFESYPQYSPQFLPQNGIPPPFYFNYSEEVPGRMNYLQNPNYQCEGFAINNFGENKQDYVQSEQDELYKIQNLKKNRAKPVFEKQKQIKKIAFQKFPKRRNYSREVTEEHDIVCHTPMPIPKGARPILSARNK